MTPPTSQPGSAPGSDSEHAQLRVDLGAYLLGGLTPSRARQVEEHLATCDACTAERDALLPAVGALADVRRSGTTRRDDRRQDLLDAQPPADLGERIRSSVAGERATAEAAERRQSWRTRASLTAVGAAAAAVVLVVGIDVTRPDQASDPAAGTISPSGSASASPSAPAVPMEPVTVEVEQPGITAGAALVNHTWGVEVKLEGSGFAAGERYQVMVLGTDGTAYPAGQFVGTGSTDMHCNLSSSVLRAGAAGFEVLDPQGDVVVTSTFT